MMRRVALVFLVALGCLGSRKAHAMFMHYQTVQVPLGRLFTNLQERLARNTNDFETTYDLARLHAMAYSTNLVTVNVRTNGDRPEFYSPYRDSGVPKAVYLWTTREARAQALRHLTNAILLYERAIMLLKQSSNAAQHAVWLVLPVELGHAWCMDQAGRRDEALIAYRRALATAWKKEVTGDFSFAEWARDAGVTAKSGKQPVLATTGQGVIGPGVCYSDEIIGYMIDLLDAVKDRKEIADLREKQRSRRTSRAVTPILLPLGPATALEELVDPDAGVTFDLDGSGLARRWGWITPQAAWLVFDGDGQGQITSALQMFGNVTFWIFWRDGYEALRSLDDNQDGVLRGAELRGLALWQDRNSDGVSDPGEVRPVGEWGITSISCSAETHSSGISWSPRGAVFADGETRPTYDWTAPSRPDLGPVSHSPGKPGQRRGRGSTALAPGPEGGLNYGR